MEVITDLLEQFGQGGPCSDIVPEHVYHNSFLIADANEAWILETARTFWVAQRVTSGVRNISNCMSITTQIDKMSKDLLESAKHQGPDHVQVNCNLQLKANFEPKVKCRIKFGLD